jgi:hypothetical protein
MILSLLSLYFVGQNLYSYLKNPMPVVDTPKVEIDHWG